MTRSPFKKSTAIAAAIVLVALGAAAAVFASSLRSSDSGTGPTAAAAPTKKVGPSSPPPIGVNKAMAAEMFQRAEGVSRVTSYSSLWATFPNVKRTLNGRELDPVAQSVVVGRISAVEPGLGFYAGEHTGEHTVTTTYDDPKADWRTLHVKVDVEDTVAGPQQPSAVWFSIPTYSEKDAKAFIDGLPALGRVMVPLEARPTYPDKSVPYIVVENGGLLTVVAEDGSLSLPFIEDEKRAARLLGTVDTLVEVRAKAATPQALTVKEDLL